MATTRVRKIDSIFACFQFMFFSWKFSTELIKWDEMEDKWAYLLSFSSSRPSFVCIIVGLLGQWKNLVPRYNIQNENSAE